MSGYSQPDARTRLFCGGGMRILRSLITYRDTGQVSVLLDIKQAKGILMERHRITAEVAFGYLSQASQSVNMKLTAVARHLVETGELLR
jgi:hypothetical protein